MYPLNPKCETQPRVTISDITLKNITSKGGLLPAGIIRCNETNPCKNFHFEDVQLKSLFWDTLQQGFITEFVEGRAINVHPDPGFKPAGWYDSNKGELYAIEDAFSYEEIFKMMLRVYMYLGPENIEYLSDIFL